MRMVDLIRRSAPRLGLLLALALALGGLFFLFDLFRGLISSGPSDILAVSNSVGETSQIPSGAGLVAVLAPAMCFVLSGVTALLMWRWLTSREHKRLWIIVLGGIPAFTLLGLGIYLAVFGPTIGGLFNGEVPYDQHPVEVAGVKPLGLALLAAFLLSVVFAAITRPLLLPIPLVAWLVAALITGMFQSSAIHGLDLFPHPSQLKPTAAYANAVERYRPLEIEQPANDIPAIETPAIQRIVEEIKHVPGLQDPAGTIPEPVGEERLPGLETLQFLVDALWDVNKEVREEAVATLEALDADVIPLETGGFIVSSDEFDFWAPGATAFRSAKPDAIEVFQVTGADHSGYLRTGVGVSYADGLWRQDNSNRISYVAGTQPRGLVIERLLGVSQPGVSLSELTISPDYWGALLAWPDQDAIGQFIQDEVTVSSIGPDETVPAGVLPVSLGVRQASFDGSYLPWDATFESESGLAAYRWTSRVPQFSLDELKLANLAPGTTYLGLPLGLPNRITQLALEITSVAESPYLKAKAIEKYLRNNYKYAFAEPKYGGPLPGRDPVDWFLFDEPEGTCGQFSSAFVILARSVGIPARIVSGWVVGEVGVTQTVYSDQAHQWAEVPFEGLGWVTFEPSAQGAAPFRAPVLSVWEAEFQRLVEVLLSGDKEKDRAEAAFRLLEIAPILDLPTGRVLEPLVEALIADDSEMVRAAAVDALGLLGDARAIGPLIDRLANDEQPTVREAVANSLANFEGPEVLEALVEALADEDERVRSAVAEALGDLGDPAAFPPLMHALSDDYPRVRESAAEGLRKLGEDVTELENGKYAISPESGPITVLGGGASTSQASKGERFYVFKVGGALHTGYLRDGVGDLYHDGRWAQIDLLELPYDANERIGDLGVSSERLKGQSRGRFNPPRWVPERIRPAEDHEDEISLSPVYTGPSDLGIPEGVIPTSLQLERVAVPGVYRPYSSTFVADDPVPGLTWTSRIPIFAEAQLTQAKPAEAGGYLQLPDDLPPRIRELALEFKNEYENPYLRARAIENYLKTDYSYAYSQPGGPRLPAGQDPVDWFLFESKEGTCGQFSSAFVLLARSAGIPARVVTGWAIGDVEVSQAVYSDQAHQWAEVPFENLGWVTFEPTASGSARSRAPEQQVWRDELRRLAGLLANSPDADLRAEATRELANLSEKASLSNLSITRKLIMSMGNDDDARVRAAAAHALGEIGHQDSIAALRDALTDDDSGVREAVREALERLGATNIPPENGASVSLSGQAGSLLNTMEAQNPGAAALAMTSLAGVGAGETDALELAAAFLSSNIESVRTAAGEALDTLGAKVSPLENGGSVIAWEGQSHGSPGTSTSQAAEPDPVPLFQVTGAANTGYLRTATGDQYSNGQWTRLDPLELPYRGLADVRPLVDKGLSAASKEIAASPLRPGTALLAWPKEVPAGNYHQSDISVSAHPQAGDFPPGVLPISYHLDHAEPNGTYWPFSATFRGDSPESEYSWRSRVPLFSQDQLSKAKTIRDPAYTQFPDDSPRFIRGLAEEITWGLPGPYAKAKAIETYLKTHYTYAFASPGDRPAPPGRDPVDWFLTETGKGTCGQFSSAFVLMARSVGIPARVVSGWAIDQTQGTQTVLSSQAHQWAEVAFSDLGWVTFEPTAAGGAPSRTPSKLPELKSTPVPKPEGPTAPKPMPGPGPVQPAAKQVTVTEITEWPNRTRKGVPFTIGGSVVSQSGAPVDGMDIEIFVNVKKENGGIEVGTGATDRGRFEVELRIPRTFTAGSYQLIAHAIANDGYSESWSDPEIGVYSTTGLEFTGPAEIAIDVPAIFRGTLTKDTGDPVNDREVQVRIDGRTLVPLSTDENGVFEFENTFEAAGERTVEVAFEEQDFMLGVSASLDVSVTMPTALIVDLPGVIGMDQEFSVSGALRDIRGNSLADQMVLLSLNSAASEPIETNALGEFQFGLSVDRPGVHTIDTVFHGSGNLESSASSLSFVVTEPISLQMSGEGPARVGEEYVINGSLADIRGNPMVDRTVAISTNSLPDTPVQTDAQGQIRLTRTFDRRGAHRIEARFATDGFLQSATSSIAVKVTEPVSLRLTGSGDAHVGRDLLIDGTLLDAGGNPLAQQTVTAFLNDQVLPPVESDSQGVFQLRIASVQPGKHTLEAAFQGGDLLEPASSQLSFKATEPVFMRIAGDEVVRVGEAYHLTGVLSGPDDRPLPGMPLTIEVEGRSRSVLDTDARGGFSWDTTFSEETRTTVKIEFLGNNELGPALVHWPMLVGVPEIVVEPLEPVARGDFLTLRGVVVIGPQTMKDIAIVINGEDATRSNAAGTFVVRHAVPGDSPLGRMEIELAASELEATTTVEGVVKSATSIIVSPLERVRPGYLLPVEVTLLNDQGLGISNAPVHYGQVTPATTGPGGVATLTIQTPHDEGLSAIPITFRFDGDDANLPLTYFVGLPVAQTSFNWLLWVGMPTLVILAVAGGYLGGRRSIALPLLSRRGAALQEQPQTPVSPRPVQVDLPEPAPGQAVTSLAMGFPQLTPGVETAWKVGQEVLVACTLLDEEGFPVTEESVDVTWAGSEFPERLITDQDGKCESSWTGSSRGDYWVMAEFPGNDLYLPASAVREFRLHAPVLTHIEISFDQSTDDLPNIWGVGEELTMVFTLLDESGEAVIGREVEAIIGNDHAIRVVTGSQGTCNATWTVEGPGAYTVTADFQGDENYLPSSARSGFEVVQFRDDIVQRYNTFLDWVRERVPNVSTQATPREMEVMVVSSGLYLDQRSLEIVISRFEEADYSEHEIERRQFEAMYRACRRIVGD